MGDNDLKTEGPLPFIRIEITEPEENANSDTVTNSDQIETKTKAENDTETKKDQIHENANSDTEPKNDQKSNHEDALFADMESDDLFKKPQSSVSWKPKNLWGESGDSRRLAHSVSAVDLSSSRTMSNRRHLSDLPKTKNTREQLLPIEVRNPLIARFIRESERCI